MNEKITDEDQMRAMMKDGLHSLMRIDPQLTEQDCLDKLTISRAAMREFLIQNPTMSREYLTRAADMSERSDVYAIVRGQTSYSLVWMDHGRAVVEITGLSELDAIMEHLIATYGLK